MGWNNNKKGFLFLVLFSILLIPSVSGAVVTGKVYDKDFQMLKDVVIEIDSFPKPTFVSKGGGYNFTLTSGRYNLIAFYKDENNSVFFTTKEVLITVTGTYVVDLILDLPYDGTLPDEFRVKPINWMLYSIVGFLGLAVIILTFLLIRKRRLHKPQEEKEEVIDDIEKATQIIRQNGGRITQKELRDLLPRYSEAKVSLIITEMESKEIVGKIKKGRGNVIILKRGK